MFQLNGRDKLFDWLAHEPNPDNRQAMLDWLALLCDDPYRYGTRLPSVPVPVFLAITPVRNVTLKYLVAEQFHTVNIIAFGRLP